MQVNNVQSPNFGMALRIKNPKETAKALKELPLDLIRGYKKAGEVLENTKFYHVEVGPDLKPGIVSTKGAYWGPAKSSRRDIVKLGSENDNLGIGSVYGVSRLRGGEVAEDGMVHHNVWSNCGPISDGKRFGTINALADVAVTLDEAAVDFAVKEAAKRAEEAATKAKVAEEVDDLIRTFSAEA